MLNFFKSSPPKITEKMLIDSKIKILLREDLSFDKSKVIAFTGSGKYYKGTYKNWPVSVKVVDITTDDLIINEFIYWNAYNGNDHVLSIFGVCLSESKAYIVLEFFNVTMEAALYNKMINNKTKIILGEQLLHIISKFQHDNKKILDLRPGVFGITENGKLKLLDFGYLINPDRLINHDKLLTQRIMYMPPEYIVSQVEDIQYDIWSFGCIMLDIFFDMRNAESERKKKFDEIKDDIIKGKYPIVSSNAISPIAMSMILKCIEKDYEKRIKIDELEKEYQLFIESANMENVAITAIEINQDKKDVLQGYYDFIDVNEKEIARENNIINTEELEKSDIYLKGIEAIHKDEQTEINLRMDYINKTLREDYELKENILMKIKASLIEKVSAIRKLLIDAVGDIMEIQDIFIEMKQFILFLNKTEFDSSKSEGNPIISSMNKSIDHIKMLLSKYSNIKYFDKIEELFKEAKRLIDLFKDICTHRDTLMDDIIEVISTHKKKFIESTQIQSYLNELNISPKAFNDIDVAKGQRMKYHNYYVKPIQNTNNITVFDLNTKCFSKLSLENIMFYDKSYFFYDIDTHIIYQSGGIVNTLQTNEVYEIKFQFDIINMKIPPKAQLRKLPLMLQPHINHSVIKISDNYLFVIGGSNTTFCEVFNIAYEKWNAIPELPFICQNSSLCYYMRYLYLFTLTNEDNSHGVILRLRLRKSLFPDDENSNNNLKWENSWESIAFKSDFTLRCGMGCYVDDWKDKVYLFGGCDREGNYHNNILNIVLGEKDKSSELMEFENLDMEDYIGNDIQNKRNILAKKEVIITSTNEELQFDTFFNSNFVCFDGNYLSVIDSIGNCFEYDTMTEDCYVYNQSQ